MASARGECFNAEGRSSVSALRQGKPDVRELRLRDVRTDGGTQTRASINGDVLEEYAELLADGTEFPPGVVFYDGKDYWLADGFHRHAAAIAAGLATFHFEVRKGSKRDALLYAVGANAHHGLKRSVADKRRAVEALLRDREWSKWGDREIARRCGVSKTFVGKVRGVINPETVGTPRLAERGGQVYEMRPAAAAPRVNTERDIAAAGEQPRGDRYSWLHKLMRFTPEQFVRLQGVLGMEISTVTLRSVAEAVEAVELEASAG
jgi:hypothetical protein